MGKMERFHGGLAGCFLTGNFDDLRFISFGMCLRCPKNELDFSFIRYNVSVFCLQYMRTACHLSNSKQSKISSCKQCLVQ